MNLPGPAGCDLVARPGRVRPALTLAAMLGASLAAFASGLAWPLAAAVGIAVIAVGVRELGRARRGLRLRLLGDGRIRYRGRSYRPVPVVASAAFVAFGLQAPQCSGPALLLFRDQLADADFRRLLLCLRRQVAAR